MNPEVAPVPPAPVPAHIDLQLKTVLSQIKSGQRGSATITATTSGVEGTFGQTFTRGRLVGNISAYGAKEFGRGATAGIRGQFSW